MASVSSKNMSLESSNDARSGLRSKSIGGCREFNVDAVPLSHYEVESDKVSDRFNGSDSADTENRRAVLCDFSTKICNDVTERLDDMTF